jgi:hypothetical protein
MYADRRPSTSSDGALFKRRNADRTGFGGKGRIQRLSGSRFLNGAALLSIHTCKSLMVQV